MEISVILPTHDDGPAMLRTLSSVLAEQKIELEAIVVDDGSAAPLPESVLLTDPHVRVFRHAMNLGVSAARNTGLAAARGECVYFADAGDAVESEGLSVLLEEMRSSQADAVIASYRLDASADLKRIGAEAPDLFPENCLPMSAPAGLYGREEFPELLAELLKNDLLHPVAARAYRRSALEAVCFDETVYCQLEDEMFNLSFFRQAKRVSVIESCAATVTIAGPDALSNGFDADRRFNLLKLRESYESLLSELSAAADSPLAHECRKQLMFHYLSMLANCRREAKRMDSVAMLFAARHLLLPESLRAEAEELGLAENWLVSTLNVVVDAILSGVRRKSFPFDKHGDMLQNLALTFEAACSGQPAAAEEYAARALDTGGREAGLRLIPDSLWRLWE